MGKSHSDVGMFADYLSCRGGGSMFKYPKMTREQLAMRPNAALMMLTGAGRERDQKDKPSLLDADLFNKAMERSNERIEMFTQELLKEIESTISGSGSDKIRR